MNQFELHTAPMMGYSDLAFRILMRVLSPFAHIYTPMIVDQALIMGRVLDDQEASGPVVLQLGGGCPKLLAQAIECTPENKYSSINLNVGCPSDRVQHARMGACLMKDPELVVDCFKSMQQVSSIPITIKCRLGVDELYSYDYFMRFVEALVLAGCETFIIHARSAWLNGINPKQNRLLPPLNYEWVYQIKQRFSDVKFIINGGVGVLDWPNHIKHTDGVMLGRLCVEDPYSIHEISCLMAPATKPLNRIEIIEQYYAELSKRKLAINYNALRHLINLFKNKAHCKHWRRHLSEKRLTAQEMVDVAYQYFAEV